MTQYQYAKVNGITARRAFGKSCKTQFSTRSLERFLSENTLSKKAWLTTDEVLSILCSLKHNQAARNLLNDLFADGFKAAPEKVKQEAYAVVCEALAESGDELVDLENFVHPLSEVTPNPEDPSDDLCNMWLVASIFLKEAVLGNKKAQEAANNILFTHNPLKALPDWDNFPPLKSKVLQVINDLQEGLHNKAVKAFNQN